MKENDKLLHVIGIEVHFVQCKYNKAIKLQTHQTSKCKQQGAHCKKTQGIAVRLKINRNQKYRI